MTTIPDDLKLQSDLTARMQADTLLSKFAIIAEVDGSTEAEASIALGTTHAGGVAGKLLGSMIVVEMTNEGRDEKVNVPGPQDRFSIVVRVLETPRLARALKENYISLSVVSRRVKQLLHLFQIGDAPVTYTNARRYNDGAGTIGKEITFGWNPGAEVARRSLQPILAAEPGGGFRATVSDLTTAVHYTLDGSYPLPTSPSVALELPGGRTGIVAGVVNKLVRAVSYADGLDPSGVSELAV